MNFDFPKLNMRKLIAMVFSIGVEDMSKRTHSITEHKFTKRRRTLREMMQMIIFNKIYNPFSYNHNNVTQWLKLEEVNLPNNKICDLPVQLGTLPSVKFLNLSQNCIGISSKYKWLWLAQPKIRKTLLFLYMSKNLITELPYYIGKLSALWVLDVSYNALRTVPESIADIPDLGAFYVSYNSLFSLPIEIFIRPFHLDVSMNPCIIKDNSKNESPLESKFPSLKQLSAATVRRYRIPYSSSLLPDSFVDCTDSPKRCILCKNLYRIAYVRSLISCELRSTLQLLAYQEE
ncbi:PREDICTED: leucine-rich repeat protein soc-2-like [Vollenhovia emeryi]|uniref:leucine-rich repeat protein soc-2-like n=1 Tax=Vollenhovia emeryi TaxID=411798 RepID=UPI0005F5417D|nr:PREDICTED: leucine-rich repeat protein soc-2-like [Vollenhovia emeryi]